MVFFQNFEDLLTLFYREAPDYLKTKQKKFKSKQSSKAPELL